ncbi:hypothetical protein ASZ90_018275 [hydrocarbon metagenome]|uniref:Uncharacterized protein n=1 Tax=hydrocarbon metagenome TaxID=938273 RepID=A0A0W8E6Q4_9ZZZZ
MLSDIKLPWTDFSSTSNIIEYKMMERKYKVRIFSRGKAYMQACKLACLVCP